MTSGGSDICMADDKRLEFILSNKCSENWYLFKPLKSIAKLNLGYWEIVLSTQLHSTEYQHAYNSLQSALIDLQWFEHDHNCAIVIAKQRFSASLQHFIILWIIMELSLQLDFDEASSCARDLRFNKLFERNWPQWNSWSNQF